MKINILKYKEAQDNERECWETAHGNLDLALEMLNKRYSKLIGMFEAETQLKENYKILDVGCGPTYISRLFTKGEKYGIDPLLMFYARIFKNQKSVISIQAAGGYKTKWISVDSYLYILPLYQIDKSVFRKNGSTGFKGNTTPPFLFTTRF